MSDQPMSDWQTSVSRVDEGKVLIRGYDLEALIGGQSFTSSCFLLLRGRLPSPGEERALDAVLNAVLDYALLKPGTVAARYAVSANPSMVAGLAAAVLSVGSYTLAPEDTARFVLAAYDRHLAAGTSLTETAGAIVADARARKERIPGIGHPLFKGVDPRGTEAQADRGRGRIVERPRPSCTSTSTAPSSTRSASPTSRSTTSA